ncbi:uncharacterized protein Tco025E_00686 [Trypanosoma conorhini]|uniref:Uncharacterized protein n=1 Tax=Trypanosoma conorhini TaxID=83891 RepID=A0A422QAR0_9TRYP|nr:uncharacterized protein Tco025E_00686 [Trypanosoma conorhini]RNF27049.1 hypothetical protein Tco025E_00686 [Trypanosoma conorhini]
MQWSASPCRVADSIDAICPNVLCPHRQAIGRERYTSMQLTAANRLLEEGQHYLSLKTERLEAEVKVKNEQLQQLDALARREAGRRAELEEEVAELRRKSHARCSAAYSNAVSQEAELARLHEERKLLVEQVLQLQSALNDMVRLNEALQCALRSNDIGASTLAPPLSQETPTSVPHCQSRSVLAPSAMPSSSSPATRAFVATSSHVDMPAVLKEDSVEVAKSTPAPTGDSKEVGKRPSSTDDKQRQECHLAMVSMQSAVSELASLQAFLNSLGEATSE